MAKPIRASARAARPTRDTGTNPRTGCGSRAPHGRRAARAPTRELVVARARLTADARHGHQPENWLSGSRQDRRARRARLTADARHGHHPKDWPSAACTLSGSATAAGIRACEGADHIKKAVAPMVAATAAAKRPKHCMRHYTMESGETERGAPHSLRRDQKSKTHALRGKQWESPQAARLEPLSVLFAIDAL